MWLPVAKSGSPLGQVSQSIGARAGRIVAGGGEVVVHASPTGALFALVRGGQVDQAWRVSSATSIGEVQLAEPFDGGLLVVLRVWAENRAEFVVLVLGRTGLASSFAVDLAEWAESAPLGRFRLRGGTLYQLRSTPTGAEIVTFDVRGVR
jgi:hypothetical protein